MKRGKGHSRGGSFRRPEKWIREGESRWACRRVGRCCSRCDRMRPQSIIRDPKGISDTAFVCRVAAVAATTFQRLFGLFIKSRGRGCKGVETGVKRREVPESCTHRWDSRCGGQKIRFLMEKGLIFQGFRFGFGWLVGGGFGRFGSWSGGCRGGWSRGRYCATWFREKTLSGPPIEHGFDVLPGVDYDLGWVAQQFGVPPPRIEIGRVRLDILVTVCQAMRVEHKLVGAEEHSAVMTFDTFGSRGIVARGNELPTAAPCTLVINLHQNQS